MREASQQMPRPRKPGAFSLFQGSLKLNATFDLSSVISEYPQKQHGLKQGQDVHTLHEMGCWL